MKLFTIFFSILILFSINTASADFGDGGTGNDCECGTGCGGGDFGGIICPSDPPTDEECLGNARVYAYRVFLEESLYDWTPVFDAWKPGDPEIVSFFHTPQIDIGDNSITLTLLAEDRGTGHIEAMKFDVILNGMPQRTNPQFIVRCHMAEVFKQ
jgi:hypothetical protein